MASPAESTPPPGAPKTAHPIIRNALRVSLSASEYKSLHEKVISRLPPAVQNRTLDPTSFREIVKSQNKYNEAAIRASLRVILVTGAGMKLFAYISQKLAERKAPNAAKPPKVPFRHSPAFRLSAALSLTLLLHRLLRRFFLRLRANLRTDDARPFRERNPRISRALTSKYAPAIGSSLAGFALGAFPQSQLRLTLAIYMSTRSLEFLFNELDAQGWFKDRPWWFGSWLLMPVSFAQLFHAFIFDRDAEPKWFGDFILKFTPGHTHPRPGSYPVDRHWPDQYEAVDALAKISELRWPVFTSPILHPSNPKTLPDSLQSISVITSPAHPSIGSLSCALLHPKSPSCVTASLHQYLLSIPLLARFLTKVYLALSLLKFKAFLTSPILAINGLCTKILSRTAIISTSLGAAWGSVCLFNSFLPRSLLPTQRFYLSGALGGLPFALAGQGNRSLFLYFFRLAVDSAWKVGKKRGVWRGWKGGDLFVFVASWALIGALLEKNPSAVDGAGLRKAFAWLRGDGFVDLVETAGTTKKVKKAAAAASE
ncbi:uncharacterized protein BDCG_07257 [Blastomyces dermatitidis ER-3]|uniref:Transmembrane protein 135 N-terminal domain-containing protein n=2 Tax=Ajellomyces dermatitidis TaxID=5039 RepID=F2T5S1_AJEDA|nr:uncharacterized protein BDCG_07257 [Blastomyces dermatitidis ER-3]EEQ92137.2 hypothetical protein BDCG_07257 [Blastomyces dermatitidis ER-3]EGE78584.1 hypothetical protein BDDG_01521 [Blastomyces dermatitidis ATCC 18188]